MGAGGAGGDTSGDVVVAVGTPAAAAATVGADTGVDGIAGLGVAGLEVAVRGGWGAGTGTGRPTGAVAGGADVAPVRALPLASCGPLELAHLALEPLDALPEVEHDDECRKRQQRKAADEECPEDLVPHRPSPL